MKWAIIALILLGLLAALFAGILVSSLRFNRPATANSTQDVDVVLTRKSLPAMSVVTSSHVSKDTSPVDKLPEGYLSSPTQAVGRILAVPVVEGQILTQHCFVTEGTAAQVAASLPDGMRAFSVSLSSSSITGGLLYPGCVVDVLATFNLRRADRGEAVSTTLLRGIQVLAVENVSVVSQDTDEDASSQRGRSRGGHQTVTLMVDSKQAMALQLAVSYGKISLAMRNPLDKSPVDTEATVLSEGRLAKLGSALNPSDLAAKDETIQPTDKQLETNESTKQTKEVLPAKKPWSMTVIRGQEIKEQDLDIPE